MNAAGDWRAGGLALVGAARGVVAAVLASALAAGCDYPFEPFEKSQEGPFSVFGYLDLRADTQWVRVMPVRQHLLLDPAPIDATVTLERLGGGRTVTLNDALFTYTDRQLNGVAYAHNFWTTERLEPGATYRLRAQRSDGASTTADVVMPPDLEFTYYNTGRDNALLKLRAEHILYVDVIHAMSTLTGVPTAPVVLRQPSIFGTDGPGTHNIFLGGGKLEREGLVDVRREEIRLAVAPLDWPYGPDLSDLEVSLPGTMPSNVENGLGFVGGVATWTIPFHYCEFPPGTPIDQQACTTVFNGESASITGKVIGQPCGDPQPLTTVRLTETLPGENAVVRRWKTGWDGAYRFEGITPGAALVLSVEGKTDAVHLPALAKRERYVAADISVPTAC